MTEHMGMNRTGLQMSPLDSQAMQQYAGPLPAPSTEADALALTRADYAAHAPALGSVPLPGSIKGAMLAAGAMLTGDRPEILLDKLAERLAFERGGTRLYDALLDKCQALDTTHTSITEAEIRRMRNDEAHHFLQIGQAIEELGGDPTCQTPSADLVGMETLGLVQVLSDPRTSISQALHAILTAELSDQAGWEALIALAEAQDQPELAQMGSIALAQERDHVQMISTWYRESLGLAGPGQVGAADRGTNIQSQGKEIQ
ncbi:ferritin-like domain-containing protein [Pseudoduganella violaceinigra]|uniref:ferritin-like domain-containing protein n=1 Tax=Pseudoduganella violaceinigra TaxID=246602 RepID=UPI00041A5B71|nr:ferritin-like domain-containing protein [Pseudoduganella violaceinigra]